MAEYLIAQTNRNDLPEILHLFEEAIKLQNKKGYKVWNSIDQKGIEQDIKNGLQYKIVTDNNIVCIFSIQHNDPFIWHHLDKDDAIYLHRIVVNQDYKGQKQFEKILNWAIQYAKQHNRPFIRMDTWADNLQLINYYQSFGFRFIKNYQTTDTKELPTQNRNLNVALLELTVGREEKTTTR
jgi:ribosomal protein S18 acetylase RimI-like enzyme